MQYLMPHNDLILSGATNLTDLKQWFPLPTSKELHDNSEECQDD